MFQKCKLLGLLTPNQTEVLKALASIEKQLPGQYWRPRDLGAYRGSHHGKTLQLLCEAGLVGRRPLGAPSVRRPNFEYRATPKGLAELQFLQRIVDLPAEAVPGRAADVARVRMTQALVGGC